MSKYARYGHGMNVERRQKGPRNSADPTHLTLKLSLIFSKNGI